MANKMIKLCYFSRLIILINIYGIGLGLGTQL